MAQIWITSDTHFGHENIIRYCDRPFRDAREMDEVLVTEWNRRVKPQDHVYHLGDVTMDRSSAQKAAFIRLIKGLNGHKRLVMGNHDHFRIRDYLDAGFEKIMAMQRFDDLWFTHVPVHPYSMGSARANIHGHVHDADDYFPVDYVNKEGKRVVKPFINVCVEKTNYHPLTLEEVKVLVDRAVKRWKRTHPARKR